MSWLDNAVIYQIFIDRFAGFKSTKDWQKPDYLGGNINGIIEKLPHIRELGVNTIWISPFCSGVAYHGYHITDFYSVDEHFGTEGDLKNLIKLAHTQKLKIICDFVPNHCSNRHPFFLDAVRNRASQYRDWFIFIKWPGKYQCFLSVKELPKLNLDNKEVRKHLLNSARKWLALGLDGLRIDHVVGISNANLKKLIDPLRKEFPEAVFIGEAWVPRSIRFTELKTILVSHKYSIWLFQRASRLYENYVGILDGVLDFQTAEYLNKYALKNKERYGDRITDEHKKLGARIALPTFLDNHDMERFLFRCGGDVKKLKQAARLQFSLKEPVIIYYGTEIGMSQSKPFTSLKEHGDILAREPMMWDVRAQDLNLLSFYKRIICRKLSE